MSKPVLKFSTIINSNVKTVWHTMLDHPTYEKWTAEFEPNSTYLGTWNQGETIKFTSSDREMEGLMGKIKENRYLEYVCVEYIGMLKKGEMDTNPEAVEFVKDSYESYTFTKISDNETKIDVELVSTLEFANYLNEAWPKALEKLKSICE